MKLHILILFIAYVCNGFAQKDSTSNRQKAYAYMFKQCDSLYKIKNDLHDGKYMVYFEPEKINVAKIFYLEKGKVTNLYREYSFEGYTTTGYYKNDSLWTFHTNPQNKEFKRASWSYLISHQIGIQDDNFTYDFDSDSLFIETRLYFNDNLVNVKKHHQRLGLLSETRHYFNGKIEYEYTNYNNTILEKNFDTTGNLTRLVINNEEKLIEIGLNFKTKFYSMYKASGKFIIIDDKINQENSAILYDIDGSLSAINTYDNSNSIVQVNYLDKKPKITNKKVKPPRTKKRAPRESKFYYKQK